MLSISLLCICTAYSSMQSVTGDETLKCGMESEKTIGTRYDFPHLSGSTLTEIEDHNRVARRAFDSTPGEESFGISYDRDRRVVNGTIAESLENFPWIADLSLHLKVDDYENDSHPFNVHICGGAIISEYFILTAAHCLEKTLQLASHTNWTASLRVSIGEFDQSQPDLLEEHFYVETAIIHEDYNMSDYLVNDIGLIQIRAKDGHGIQFNQHIKPVCLPSASTPYVENNLVLAGGWGISFTEHDILKNYSRYIHTGEVPLVTLSLCQVYCNLFTGGNETDPHCLKAGHLCVGHEEGGTDTCNGDSGGPIVQNINGRFTVMGLTSFGHPTCGKKGYPAIYTNVQYYLSWILTTMKTLSSN